MPRPQDEPTIESRYDNTIELAFAKLKALLRSAAARTVTDLWAAIHKAFTFFLTRGVPQRLHRGRLRG